VILQAGEKIHVVHRRLFEKNARRHFVGVVECYDRGEVRAHGHVFVLSGRDQGVFQRKPDHRTRTFSVLSGNVFVNILPDAVDIDRIVYEFSDNTLWVTDGSGWRLDLKEFGWG